MKKIVFFSIFLSLLSTYLVANASQEQTTCFTSAFSAGYVFKHDCTFKKVYGHGIVNIITVDGCYYPWELWGIGAKVSYWRAQGRTSFLKQCSHIKEVPITLYVRGMKDFRCNVQLYLSLGGGVIWIKEKSYLGCVTLHKGIGEVEVGLHYPIWHCLNFTSAFRYLFPRQSQGCAKVDVGGFDVRAGIGFSF